MCGHCVTDRAICPYPDGYDFGYRGAEGCQIGDEPERGNHFHLWQPFYLNLPQRKQSFPLLRWGADEATCSVEGINHHSMFREWLRLKEDRVVNMWKRHLASCLPLASLVLLLQSDCQAASVEVLISNWRSTKTEVWSAQTRQVRSNKAHITWQHRVWSIMSL